MQAVKDNAPGQPQSSIALYVAAPMDANITNNWQLLHVVDQRTLPGEDISFPLVTKLMERILQKQHNRACLQHASCQHTAKAPLNEGSPARRL
jgi:hypothetical protein